ncbi:type IV secretion system DNA-binding domain-containing protein, partial [Candidatus Saccharibacteria bacterium]|nr:type IV secretion system DNA-binding domain-containing protein [Candidatus Saccharibacteria bacterium]
MEEGVLLLLEVPRANDKKELAAEQMFAALHGILRPRKRWGGAEEQEHISFEIAAIDKRIRFYVWTPRSLQSFVEGQIYAQYPSVQIQELEQDYAGRQLQQTVVHSTELVLTDNETIPIKTFPSFEVDPLAAMTATLAKLDDPNEEMWIQIIARPIQDDWHKRGAKMIEKIKGGGGSGFGTNIAQILGAPMKVPEYSQKPGGEKQLSERDRGRVSAIETKSTKLGYQVKVRIIYAGNNEITARLRLQAMVGTFKQFNTTNLNGFTSKRTSYDPEVVQSYAAREFKDNGYILNIEEVASLYHLPHTSVETPNIDWANSKTAEPPANLPSQGKHHDSAISLFGVTNFRGHNEIFGALRSDRGRHIYILGQTGTGKSGLLELLALSDVFYDQGYAIIDPHGDFAVNNMRFIPEHRIKDVVYFNPADASYPIGFNPLEVYDNTQKGMISSELVGVMKRMFDSWGPRLEYILRYTLLALLDYPNSTMLDITRMLTDKFFRRDVIDHIQDIVVKNFWVTEFASWNEKYATEAVAPVLNKVGAFTANPMIRNIIGQPKGSFNIRKIMDEGKILIMNLSRGLIGEDNAAILGAMMVTKVQLAAMSRADIPRIEDRRPFYLYVDEFQNFATDSFAVILSEARKYGLNLTVANQYISQMSDVVRGAVFGNVGTMVSFRVSPDDAPFLEKYYTPQFTAQDIIQLANRS